FTKDLERHPRSAPGFAVRAIANAKRGHWSEAVGDFAAAETLAPQQLRTWENREAAYGILEQWDRRQVDCANALASINTLDFRLQDEFDRLRVARRIHLKPRAPYDPFWIWNFPPDDNVWIQSASLRLVKGDVKRYQQLCQTLVEKARK